jgi:ABC-2 type transport system permease protein
VKTRAGAILHKEFLHILRDPRSLAVVFLYPLSMVLLYGYAITFDIKNIRIGWLDQDRTPASRAFGRELTAGGYFEIAADLADRNEAAIGLRRRRFTAVVVAPPGFGRALRTEPRAAVQLLVDGSNPTTASVAINTLRSFCAARTLEWNAQALRIPLSAEPRVWYNPDLKTSHFVVPGLVAVVMMMICALLTSVTLARERETGTLEQILVSPIRPFETVIGKVAPYIVLAIADAALVIVFSMAVFRVPFRGDAAFLLVAALAYVYCALAIGVFISSWARTQQVAMMAAQLMTFLPSFLLSGFLFPIASLPKALQALTLLVPARYFLVIIRAVMLKGAPPSSLAGHLLFLAAFGTVVLLASARRFRVTLED